MGLLSLTANSENATFYVSEVRDIIVNNGDEYHLPSLDIAELRKSSILGINEYSENAPAEANATHEFAEILAAQDTYFFSKWSDISFHYACSVNDLLEHNDWSRHIQGCGEEAFKFIAVKKISFLYHRQNIRDGTNYTSHSFNLNDEPSHVKNNLIYINARINCLYNNGDAPLWHHNVFERRLEQIEANITAYSDCWTREERRLYGS